jgi:hypothetical protein
MKKKEFFSLTFEIVRYVYSFSRARTAKISVNNQNAMDKADR